MISYIIEKILYRKLISYLGKCDLLTYKKDHIEDFFLEDVPLSFFRNFLIFNKHCRRFFYKFVDESIKLLGPDTKFQIMKSQMRITAKVFIDNRARNKRELLMKLKYNLDDMYFHYGHDHYFVINIDFADR